MAPDDLLTVRLARKTREADAIASFELVAADGADLPPFAPGAHVDVHLPGGVVRQYSLCNDARETHRYVIAVLRDAAGRGGSRAMHALPEGARLTVGRPRNLFALSPHAGRTLLVAGGIGITPLLCMARHLDASGADFALHYCVRSAARAAFVDQLQTGPFAHRVRVYADDGPPLERLDVDRLLAHDDPAQPTHLYVCGPAGLIAQVTDAALARGWERARIRTEFFAAPPDDVTRAAGDVAFDVRLAASDRTIRVPAGTSVVDSLAAHGVDVPVSCRQGVCGSCLTTVLAGEPAHRDHYLTDDERALNDRFLPCCSRARGPLLVLDL